MQISCAQKKKSTKNSYGNLFDLMHFYPNLNKKLFSNCCKNENLNKYIFEFFIIDLINNFFRIICKSAEIQRKYFFCKLKLNFFRSEKNGGNFVVLNVVSNNDNKFVDEQ